ncbi:MAG: hypothetical protein WD354_00075 [Acidimicrobiia bacterium]
MNKLDTFKIEVPADVRGRHLRAISARLKTAPRRRRGLTLILIGAVLLVPLAAVAAESSLPGELLYPVKRILEPVRALFDQEVVANNRVDELEILVERRVARPTIDHPIREAETAVATRERPELRQRLDALIERIEREPDVGPAPPTTTRPTVDTTTPSTQLPETTTTAPVREPTTTTAPTRDSTRP